MGAVYAAMQSPIGREVAVKVLKGDLIDNDGARERFRREAAIIGSLRHPNTIQLVDYGETEDGTLIMVTELLVGSPLSERLKQGTLTVAETLELGLEVSGSLREAHALGLVHRDLKPANIFLVEVAGKQHGKVLDFGIARIADEDSTRLTATGQVFGTPRYMSPEQGLETGGVDARSDIYSLGLILFECLVGQPPFVAQTSLQYIQAHVSKPPPRLREILPRAPGELEAVIDACLVKNRDERLQSASVLEARLEAVKDQLQASGFNLSISGSELGSGSVVPIDASARPSIPTARPSLPTQPSDRPSLPTSQEEAPPRPAPVKAARSLNLAILASASVAIALVAFAMTLRSRGDAVVEALDAGIVTARALPDASVLAASALDAAALVVTTVNDSGTQNVSPPVSQTADAGARVGERRDAGSKKKKSEGGRKPGGGDPGSGAIYGPREMSLPGASEDEKQTIAAAKACKKGALATGAAQLKVSGCKAGCAVLVDGACAGLTPLELGIEEGNKTVTVVCSAKIVVDTLAKLRPGATQEVRCK